MRAIHKFVPKYRREQRLPSIKDVRKNVVSANKLVKAEHKALTAARKAEASAPMAAE
jgi:hypothetical protein